MGKRRRRTSSSSSSSSSSSRSISLEHSCNPQVLFGIILASISNLQIGKSTTSKFNLVILKTLHQLHLSLNSILNSQQTLHIPIFSLLPVLINSKCSEVACSGLEIVGVVSLISVEMNEQIASDDEIVNGLICAVGSSTRSVSMAACNALLDLFTTSVGRCRLFEFSAVDKLMSLNLQHLQFFQLWKKRIIQPSSE